MVQIPLNPKTTINEIEHAVIKANNDMLRKHLGASVIGEECGRKLWYMFRWADQIKHAPRILRLFARGQREEDVLIDLLTAANCDVWSVNPKTGKQWQVNWYGDHFGGSLDGVAKNLIEAPMKPHILEFKTHNDKSFKEIQKKGVKEAKPTHWAQMQIYMHGSTQLGKKQIERAYYLAVNKNDDQLYGERIKYDRQAAELLLQKAARIIVAETPLSRISDRPNWFVCLQCDYRNICHLDKVAMPSCRTCVHSQADTTLGGWNCIATLQTLDYQKQINGCGQHLYIPELIPYAKLKDSDGFNYAIYEMGNKKFANIIKQPKNIVNVPAYLSSELYSIDKSLICEDNIELIRNKFNGKVVGKDG